MKFFKTKNRSFLSFTIIIIMLFSSCKSKDPCPGEFDPDFHGIKVEEFNQNLNFTSQKDSSIQEFKLSYFRCNELDSSYTRFLDAHSCNVGMKYTYTIIYEDSLGKERHQDLFLSYQAIDKLENNWDEDYKFLFQVRTKEFEFTKYSKKMSEINLTLEIEDVDNFFKIIRFSKGRVVYFETKDDISWGLIP